MISGVINLQKAESQLGQYLSFQELYLALLIIKLSNHKTSSFKSTGGALYILFIETSIWVKKSLKIFWKS